MQVHVLVRESFIMSMLLWVMSMPSISVVVYFNHVFAVAAAAAS